MYPYGWIFNSEIYGYNDIEEELAWIEIIDNWLLKGKLLMNNYGKYYKQVIILIYLYQYKN